MIRSQPLLGTFVEIHASGAPESILRKAIEYAFKAIDSVQSLMSFHDSESELSKLNQVQFMQPTKVHPWTYKVLHSALRLHKITKGLFDCAVANKMAQCNILPNISNNIADSKATMSALHLDPDYFVHSIYPIRLDLGGIAKGFAVDKAVNTLKRYGVTQGMVNAGGDLRVFGASSQLVCIRKPDNPSTLIPSGYLKNGAIATSANYFFRGPAKEKCIAIINPETETPIFSDKSFSVIAPTCMIADGLTKFLAIKGKIEPSIFQHFKAKAVVIS